MRDCKREYQGEIVKKYLLLHSLLGLALGACSSSAPGGTAGQGGDQGSGGAGGSQTSTASGGAIAPDNGGAPGLGGTASGGGLAGTPASGGTSSAGGAIVAGGAPGKDAGPTPNGGASGTGGAMNSGGSSAPGGTTTSGGATKTDGSAGAGGGAPGGDASASGGATKTGGILGTGGVSATGGSVPIGGSVTISGCSSPAPAGSPVALHGQLKVVGGKVQDQSGNPVQLKGVSAFWLNWENPKYAESKAAMQYMRDNWKMMALRAPMGTGASGGYTTSDANKTALQARMDTIMQNAQALGVYVILDWHSGSAYQEPEATSAVTFFTGMATKYGSCPNVLYEDFNEPVNVQWATIKPYHQRIVTAIRAVDPNNLIIMGTPNWSQDVDKAAADPVTGTNLLYTLHFYSCSHAASLRAKGDTAMSKGAALFITEFGATPADGGVSPNNKVCEAEANNWFSWMATNNISGTAWKLAAGKDSSNYFTTAPPVDGPFPDSVLSQTNGASPGHGQFIVNWMRQ
jgi:endoglucanase